MCDKCNFSGTNPTNTSTFIPKQSSSAKILGCKNPKCEWVAGPAVRAQCSTKICPPYGVVYGSGSTSGILLSETLDLPEGKSVEDFVLGCSIVSTSQPSGIAGFGRGPESLPAQMGLEKFSYCLVSHRFDDEPVSSELILVGGSLTGENKTKEGLSLNNSSVRTNLRNETKGVLNYTPLFKNKLGTNSAYEEYYYVHLRKITVGGKKVAIPYNLLVPGSDGNGGTIVDSGTTFTFMERKAYEAVAREFEMQMGQYSRDADVENQSGFGPCYNISGGKQVIFPEFIFHFKGGAKMTLPLADYFSLVGGPTVVCMTIVTGIDGVTGGPSIILGNYQQQDFYLEYDLEKERLGFRKQICK